MFLGENCTKAFCRKHNTKHQNRPIAFLWSISVDILCMENMNEWNLRAQHFQLCARLSDHELSSCIDLQSAHFLPNQQTSEQNRQEKTTKEDRICVKGKKKQDFRPGGGGTSSCWRQSLRFKCKQAAEMQTLTAEEEHTTYTPPGNCASQDGQQAASFCQTVHRLFLPAVGDHTRTYGGAWWRRGGTDGHVQPIFCRISHRQSSGPEKHKSTEKSNSWWLNMMDAPQGGGNLSKKG